MSFRGMASLVAGLAGGYQQGQDRARQQAREDAEDVWRKETRDRQRTDWADQDAVKAAAAPVQATDGTVYQPAVDDDGNEMPANPTAGSGMVGATRYPTMADATAAAAQQNTPAATAERQSKVLLGQGRVAEAINHQKVAQQLKDEGHMDFVKANYALAPTADQIRAGADTFDLGGVDAFNAAGGGTIPAGARGKAFLTKTPDGREVVDYTVIGQDGKQIAPSARQFESYYGQNFKDRETTAREDAKAAQAAKYQDGMLGVAQQQATTQEKWRADQAETQRRLAAVKESAPARTSRADHFDEKAWADGYKIDPATVSFENAEGKPREVPELRLLYTSRLNEIRQRGDASPQEAQEAARTSVVMLRNAATELSRLGASNPDPSKVEDPVAQAYIAALKSKQVDGSEASAARFLLAAANKQRKPAAPPPPAAPPSGGMTAAVAGRAAAPAPAPAAAAAPARAPAPAEPSLLDRISNNPIVRRMSDLGTDYTSEQGKALLQRRVTEAKQGGQALTETEALRARQAGLI